MTQDDLAPYVPFSEFSAGLAQGRFHVVVNPTLAPAFVAHVTRAAFVALALIGSGVALALAGQVLAGGVVVALGIVSRRLVKRHAGPILLHLAQRVPGIYEQATTHGVMEVQRRG